MKACVVGCGPAGLVASKHLKVAGIDFDAFERSEEIGGTWVYSEGNLDSFGQPVHTAMYQNLRTNFPKDLMEFEGLKYSTDESFLRSAEVLKYLNEYANKYGITENIKVGHMVTNVIYKDSKWIVTVEDLLSKTSLTTSYDYIIICNGHHFTPRYPDIDGRDEFKGLQIHSKQYRKPDVFKNKIVLVIGFGYSGQDMSSDASTTAKCVFVSHHADNFISEYFSHNVVSKPDVQRLNEDTVTFVDGSVEKIDAILYCTGYKYSFPFLDSSCGVSCDGDHVTPLYRHLININYPSMAFIGLNFSTIVFYVFEAQVKTYLRVLSGETQLPTKEDMLKELGDYERKMEKCTIKRKYHMVQNERDHLHLINQIANLNDIPEVIYKIYFFNFKQRRDYMDNYRKFLYRVIDEDNYSVEFVDNK